jgi:hypothetical protein
MCVFVHLRAAIDSQLMIVAVRDEHEGYYSCKATNGYSSAESNEAYLQILPRMCHYIFEDIEENIFLKLCL